MKRLLLLVLLTASAATFAAEATLVVPQFQKSASKPVEGDQLHEKYEAAWARYEKAIAEVRGKVIAALDKQFAKAADAGNLDLTDMWDKKKKTFVATGSLDWLMGGKAKVEWRKKYGDLEFPDDFSAVVKEANVGFESAVSQLKADYDSVVKDYTKERNLARARELRDEWEALGKKPEPQPPRPIMVDAKAERVDEKKPEVRRDEEPRAKEAMLIKFLCGWKWKHGKFPVRYSFSEDGSYLLLGSPRSGKYQIISGEQTKIKLMWNGEKRVEWVDVGDRQDNWTMNRLPFVPAEPKP